MILGFKKFPRVKTRRTISHDHQLLYLSEQLRQRGGYAPDAVHPYCLRPPPLLLLFFVAPLPMQLPEQRMNSFLCTTSSIIIGPTIWNVSHVVRDPHVVASVQGFPQTVPHAQQLCTLSRVSVCLSAYQERRLRKDRFKINFKASQWILC
jgi:hypothetical protein